MKLVSVAAAVMLGGVAMHATAQMSFTSQTRTVSATGPGGSLQTATAPNFEDVQFAIESPGVGGGGSYANLSSSLSGLYLNVQVGAAVRPNGSNQYGTASAVHNVKFSTATNCAFTITGNSAFASLKLSGNGVNIQPPVNSPGWNYAGTFLAGQVYTLDVLATASPGQDQGVSAGLLITDITPAAQSGVFTYQGLLRIDGAQPGNLLKDMRFSLFPAAEGGAPIGPVLTRAAVDVRGGLFTVELDFGSVFNGTERWLQVEVSKPDGGFEALSPRTRLNSTPYASYSLAAKTVPWAGVTGVPANVSGAFSPWTVATGGINYSGRVGIGDSAPETALAVNGGLRIATGASPNYLAFGTIGNLGGTAENSDLIAFHRINLGSNSSELRLIIGDDPGGGDFFTIGTLPGGGFSPTFGFRSDGFASKPGGGSWGTLSDPRAKHDIRPMSGTLDRLLLLRGYEYLYNDDVVKGGKALAGPQIGLMADEVERVFPDWIFTDRDGMRMVSERATTALMVEALRDLRAEKDAQIGSLLAENAALRERLDRIEKKLDGAGR